MKNNPMKMALVTPNVIRGDGQSRVAMEIARHALKQGVEVTLLADTVDDEIQALGAHWIPIRPRWRQTQLTKGWEAAHLATAALRERPGQFDIVQAFGFTLNGAHSASNAQFVHQAWARSPVHTARGRRDAYGAYQWLYTRLNVGWERQSYGKAQVVIASSRRIKQQLMEIGIPEARIHVIWNGVDLAEFHPGQPPRNELGLPEGVPLALFAGDIRTPRKNLGTALRALSATPTLHLAVVGATKRSPYPELAGRLGLADRVHFLGFRRDVARLMRAADLFVFPTHYEPFGLVITEAMASGLPVVTSRCAGAAELIEHGRNGLLLDDPSDIAALGAALGRLAGDPQLRRQMGDAARETAESHSWTHMAEAHLRLYQGLCP